MSIRRILWRTFHLFSKYIKSVLEWVEDEQRAQARILEHGFFDQNWRIIDALFDEHLLKERPLSNCFHKNIALYPWFHRKWTKRFYVKDIQKLYETAVLNDERQLDLECARMASYLWRWQHHLLKHDYHYFKDFQYSVQSADLWPRGRWDKYGVGKSWYNLFDP